jgi:hypothetical protein
MPYLESLRYLLKILARVESLCNDGVRAPLLGAKRVHVGCRPVVGCEHAKSVSSLGGGLEYRRDVGPSRRQGTLGLARARGGVEAEGYPPLCLVLLVHLISLCSEALAL